MLRKGKDQTVGVDFTAYMYGGNRSKYKYTWKQNDKSIRQNDGKYDTWMKDSTYAVDVYGKTVAISTISIGLTIHEIEAEDLQAVYNIHVINSNGNVSCSLKVQKTSMFILVNVSLTLHITLNL